MSSGNKKFHATPADTNAFEDIDAEDTLIENEELREDLSSATDDKKKD